MRRGRRFRWWALMAAPEGVLSLVLVASALGALPKAGKLYTGSTSAAAYHGFTAPVSFTVSRNGRQLLGFKWAGGGCTGLGGPGNAWTSGFLNYKVGTINVSRTGTFFAKNVKTTNRQNHIVKVTTSTVQGRFKTATTAAGTISFKQKITKTCSGNVTFTATLGPAPGALRKTSPANRATGQSNRPTLRWTTSRNATSYQYCIDTSNNDVCNTSWVSTRSKTQASLSRLKPGMTYYWQVKASSSHGAVAADNASWHIFTVATGAVTPQAGHWVTTSLSGPVSGGGGQTNPGDSVTVTGLSFSVSPDQATISGFGFAYNYSGPSSSSNVCMGHGSTAAQTPSPIINGHFSTPAQTVWSVATDYGVFDGTFDSPTTAHGTAWFRGYIGGIDCRLPGYANTGTFSWTATRTSP